MIDRFQPHRGACHYYVFQARDRRLLILPVEDGYELRLGPSSLGTYETARSAAEHAASGMTETCPKGVNLLRLNAPFDIDRWDRLPVHRAAGARS